MKILKYFLILMVASLVSKTINAADDYKPVQPAYSDYDGMKLGFAFPDRQSMNIQKVFRDNAVNRAVELGWTPVETDAKWDPKQQSANIAALTAQSDIEGIVMLSIDFGANNNAAKKFEQTGRPLVTYHMGISYKNAAHVGPNFYEMGRLLASEMHKDLGGKGKVFFVLGDPNSDSGVNENRGLNDWFEENNSDIEILAVQPAYWDSEKAKQVTKTLLQQHPDVDAIFCNWDVMCVGMGQALEEAGLVGKVRTYIDSGSDVCFTGIEKGWYTKCAAWDTRDQVKRAVDAMSMLVASGWEYGDKPKIWNVPLFIIDKDNMNDPRIRNLAFGDSSGYITGQLEFPNK